MATLRPSIPTLSSTTLRIPRALSTLLRSHKSPPRPSATTTTTTTQIRTATTTPSTQKIHPLIPPPTSASGPLLTRLPNRALPDITPKRAFLKTLPIFIALLTISSLAIFNYQKSSSSTVNAVLYALRTHPDVRDILGDEIYFAAKVPWIRGKLNQLHGVIDIRFWVKGTKGQGETKFVSVRKRRDGYFETLEWSLKMEDGRVVQLLGGEGVRDPMESVVKE